MSRADRMIVSGIKLHPRIGVTSDERCLPQPCQLDLTLWGDFEAAASTDSLDMAIDYSRVIDLVAEIAHCREYHLLETLAYQVARRVLQSFPASRVGVKVCKRPASLMEKIDFVEIEIEQS